MSGFVSFSSRLPVSIVSGSTERAYLTPFGSDSNLFPLTSDLSASLRLAVDVSGTSGASQPIIRWRVRITAAATGSLQSFTEYFTMQTTGSGIFSGSIDGVVLPAGSLNPNITYTDARNGSAIARSMFLEFEQYVAPVAPVTSEPVLRDWHVSGMRWANIASKSNTGDRPLDSSRDLVHGGQRIYHANSVMLTQERPSDAAYVVSSGVLRFRYRDYKKNQVPAVVRNDRRGLDIFGQPIFEE